MTDTVSSLVPMVEYQRSRAHLFPSIASMQWFVRSHRAALIAGDALVLVAGRYLVAPEAVDAFAMRAGKEAAQKAAA